MKAVKASGILGLMILAVLASPFAMADDPAGWDSGWYIGGNVGQSRAKIDDSSIAKNLLNGGFTMTTMSDAQRDTGYKLFGGYQFNSNFALEAGYFKLGQFGFTAGTLPPGSLTGNIKLDGWNIDAIGFLPFTQNFSAFGRIGLNDAQAKDSFSGTGFVNVINPNPSKRSTNFKWGLGLQYAFTPSFAMRLEDERYRLDDAVGDKPTVDLISLGVVFRFGGGSPAPTQQAANPPPAYVPVQKAAPAPVFVVVPVAAPAQQYCSILDIQFAINQQDIRSVMNEKLGVVGTFMNKYPNTTAVIEGHTDNVGTEADNMTLSQARAQSVVDYLESDQHIAASRLSAVGYGETRPIADNSTQEGQRQNRRIDAVIACAQDVQGLTVKPARVTMALRIDYDQDKSAVKPQYHDDLQQVANFLKANPAVTALVQGNTANTQATPELAMQISVDRAQNVVNYLVDNFGIARARLTAQGLGDNRRFAYNTSAEGQAENRRVNIIIIYPN